MKDSLILPVIFLLMFLIIMILLVSGKLVFIWETNMTQESTLSFTWILQNLADAMYSVLPVSIIISLLITVSRTQKKPGIRVLSFVLPLITAFTVLVLFFSIFNNITLKSKSVDNYKNPFFNNQLHRLNDSVIYTGKNSGGDISLILRIKEEQGKPGFTFFKSGKIDPAEKTIITSDPAGRIPVIPDNPHFSPVFAPPGPLKQLFTDMELFNGSLRILLQENFVFYLITCFSIILFCMSAWIMIRISSWPLLNLLLSTIIIRLIFWLHTVFTSELSAGISSILIKNDITQILPAIVFSVLSAIVILIDVLYLLRSRKRANV